MRILIEIRNKNDVQRLQFKKLVLNLKTTFHFVEKKWIFTRFLIFFSTAGVMQKLFLHCKTGL